MRAGSLATNTTRRTWTRPQALPGVPRCHWRPQALPRRCKALPGASRRPQTHQALLSDPQELLSAAQREPERSQALPGAPRRFRAPPGSPRRLQAVPGAASARRRTPRSDSASPHSSPPFPVSPHPALPPLLSHLQPRARLVAASPMRRQSAAEHFASNSRSRAASPRHRHPKRCSCTCQTGRDPPRSLSRCLHSLPPRERPQGQGNERSAFSPAQGRRVRPWHGRRTVGALTFPASPR